MIKAIFFDLDGTLLPMNQELFVNTYLSSLAKKASEYGYEPEKLVKTIWLGTKNMIANDGYKLNEEVFWSTFVSVYGDKALKDIHIFDEFYYNEFKIAKKCCNYNPLAKYVISLLKEKNLKLVLATNPVFPKIATETRLSWSGVSLSEFDIYTTYENSRFCKPNLNYYKELLKQVGCNANECLMIGNDVDEDMICEELGMDVFLLTDCLINKSNKDISMYKKGNFNDLIEYLKKI